MPHPKVTRTAPAASNIPHHDAVGAALSVPSEYVELWREGRWYPLDRKQSVEVLHQRDAGHKRFALMVEGAKYHFDFDKMSRETEGSTSSIRFSLEQQSQSLTAEGFETFRQAFKRLAVADLLHERFGMEQAITEESLFFHWPGTVDDEELLHVTAEEVFHDMTLTNIKRVNLAEWIHYWMLRMETPNVPLMADINRRLQLLLQYDSKVLERLQLLFEFAAEPSDTLNGALSMSHKSLVQVCRSLLACPNFLLERELAREVLDRHRQGQSSDEDERLLYHDFLNVMLGKQRHKVYIWMYDISNGKANSWSWILGTHFVAFWHTAVVVEYPEGPLEFWYGGRLFMSKPGTTPFGEPLEKRFMGYCYKSQEELENYISYSLAHEFLPSNYDSLMHNCNHFSDRLLSWLVNQHLPYEILHQPEMIMNSTAILQLLRPLLNRWLGHVEDPSNSAAIMDPPRRQLGHLAEVSIPVSPLALVSFTLGTEPSGLEFIGRVEAVQGDLCVVSSLDFWRGSVDFTLRTAQLRVLNSHRSQRARMLVRRVATSDAPTDPVATGLPAARRSCCWLPVLLQPAEIVSKPSALSFTSVVEEDPVHVATF